MANEPLTLMVVHAHPDDEAIGTGGTFARYAAEGVRDEEQNLFAGVRDS